MVDWEIILLAEYIYIYDHSFAFETYKLLTRWNVFSDSELGIISAGNNEDVLHSSDFKWALTYAHKRTTCINIWRISIVTLMGEIHAWERKKWHFSCLLALIYWHWWSLITYVKYTAGYYLFQETQNQMMI